MIWPALLLLIWGGETTPNQDARLAVEAVFTELDRLNTIEEGPLHSDELGELLEALEVVVRRDGEVRINVNDGPSYELEARSAFLFKQTPKLPPENKQNNQWRFEVTRLDLAPRSIYVYNLRFKGSHTIRIREVTLHFKKGPPVVHDSWRDLEEGNGKAWSKRDYIPALNVWSDPNKRKARILTAVEILGSAQDGVFESYLDFVFEVPEPGAQPYEKALDQLARLKREVAGGPLNAVKLADLRQSLKEILRMVEP